MAETVTCRECGASIVIDGPVTEDTMIACDECGAEWDPNPNSRKETLAAVKKAVMPDIRKEVSKTIRDAVRNVKGVSVRKP